MCWLGIPETASLQSQPSPKLWAELGQARRGEPHVGVRIQKMHFHGLGCSLRPTILDVVTSEQYF